MNKSLISVLLVGSLILSSCGSSETSESNAVPASAEKSTSVTTTAELVPVIDSIDLIKDSIDLALGDSQKVPYVIMPSNADEVEIVWSTSNKNIATVDQSGNIEAVGAGTCTITVEGGGRSDSLTVNVSAADLYLSMGDYEGAYNVASDEEKDLIKSENLIAYVAKDVPNMMKNPSSFSLRDAWIDYDESAYSVILEVEGTNSMGGTISNYDYFYYNKIEKKFSIFSSVADLEEEETYSWDDDDEKLEKIFDNAARSYIKKVIKEDDKKLDKKGIDRINTMFENNVLKDVKLLPDNEKKLSELKDTSDSTSDV